MDNPITSGEQYLARVAIKKAVWGSAKFLVGFLASTKAQAIMNQFHIHVDLPEFQAALGALAFTGLHLLHDWLAVKYPQYSNWL